MFKKLTAVFIVICLIANLAGCNSKVSPKKNNSSISSSSVASSSSIDSYSAPDINESVTSTAVSSQASSIVTQSSSSNAIITPTSKGTFLFGIGEMPNFGNGGAVDSMGTPELVSNLTGALGAKSYRLWMHLTSIIDRAPDSDAVSIDPVEAAQYHSFINELKANGVTQIIALSHYYIYPAGYSGNSAGSAIPLPGTDEYTRFLNITENCYALLSAEFPDVKFWEPGNETNSDRFLAKSGYDPNADPSTQTDNVYSETEKAQITTDICYYANLGIKKTSSQESLVLPGMVFNSTVNDFLSDIYISISSGNFPRGDAKKDKNNYFNILNWHPYQFGYASQDWIDKNVSLYAVAQKYGDNGKKVFFTELGIPDGITAQVPVNNNGVITWDPQQNYIASWMTGQFDAISANMPWVSTVIMFRLLDWKVNTDPNLPPNSDEFTFGLFTTPNNTTYGCVPKPVALALFKYFNGAKASTAKLYQYEKK